jgi:hypothetical protein
MRDPFLQLPALGSCFVLSMGAEPAESHQDTLYDLVAHIFHTFFYLCIRCRRKKQGNKISRSGYAEQTKHAALRYLNFCHATKLFTGTSMGRTDWQQHNLHLSPSC